MIKEAIRLLYSIDEMQDIRHIRSAVHQALNQLIDIENMETEKELKIETVEKQWKDLGINIDLYIYETTICNRAKKCLINHGIERTSELWYMGFWELFNIEGLGKKSFRNIVNYFLRRGLTPNFVKDYLQNQIMHGELK